MNERHIILCADDYGISPAVSAAIRDLIARGRINATSVMVAAPKFDRDEATKLRDVVSKRASIVLHVTLTAPFAPLSQKLAPLRHGAFLSLATTLRRAHLRALRPKLLTVEVSLQFEAFVAAFGRPPDFVDGHHHVHLFPQIRDAVLRVTKDLAPNAWVRQCGQISARRQSRATHQSGLCRDLHISLGRSLRPAFRNLPRSAARWRRHHVPSGQG